MFLTKTLELIRDSILTVVYPQACDVCVDSVESRADGFCCRTCWLETRVFSGGESICWKCGALTGGRVSDALREQIRCGRCDEDAYTAARAGGIYEKALRTAVLSLKQQPDVPRRLLELLVATSSKSPLDRCDLIIPVPLHPRRQKERGFNQAAVIASELSKRLQLPVCQTALTRVQHTERHRGGMDARARRESVEWAFSVPYPRLIENESILLIDDVFTTGATASTCARVLVEAGASDVFVLTLARASDF